VQKPLAEGRLLRLFEATTEPKVLYSLAYPAHRANRPLLGAFRDWLLGEARAQADGAAEAEEMAGQAAE
jgi:DNA-binding transcriptional LysR family regulator